MMFVFVSFSLLPSIAAIFPTTRRRPLVFAHIIPPSPIALAWRQQWTKSRCGRASIATAAFHALGAFLAAQKERIAVDVRTISRWWKDINWFAAVYAAYRLLLSIDRFCLIFSVSIRVEQ